ncbi:hypothetical protein EsH8_III_000177 [Colletotrichum jinshuiense]
MDRRAAPPPGQGVWEKTHDADEDIDDGDGFKLRLDASANDLEEASKSLLNTHATVNESSQHRTRSGRRQCTAPWPVVVAIVLLSAVLGGLSSLGIVKLVSHLQTTNSAHRNDNTLASSANDPGRHTTYLQSAPCGRTPAEARAAGCAFDLISFNWLPSQCHDEELARNFEQELRDDGFLSWYEDMERTRPLTRAQIMTGEYTGIYVSLGYHLRHCTAMWRRMHRALMEGGGGLERVDSYIWSYHHTRHCEEVLLARHNETDVGEVFTTEVRIKYPDCGVVL